MSTSHSPQDDAELEAFLARKSPVSADYDKLELVEPTAELDARILAAAKAAATPVAKSAAGSVGSGQVWKPPPPPPEPDADDDSQTATLPAVRRPRWIMPAALAASVLAAVGVGVAMLDLSPSIKEAKSGLAAQFAKRARARSEADKAAAEVAAQELEVMVMEAPPPPPSFEADRPQVADLEASIALIRRELTVADQLEAPVEALSLDTRQEALADATIAEAPATPATPASVIQPRDRRLAKILELYDAGNPDLAKDALEMFLRDFADDPVSQRILGKP